MVLAGVQGYRPIHNPHSMRVHGQRVGGQRVGSECLAICGETLWIYHRPPATALPGEPLTCPECLEMVARLGLREWPVPAAKNGRTHTERLIYGEESR